MLVLSFRRWPSARRPVKLPQAITSGWANAAPAKAANRIIEPMFRITTQILTLDRTMIAIGDQL
jgi:hypothetical protein